MKVYFDSHRKDLQLKVNDYVMLSTKNIALPGHITKKLKPSYIGPYRIAQKIGKVAYKLDLPNSLKIHNVFHVSLLRPYHGTLPLVPDAVEVDGDSEFEVERIIAHRGTAARRQYLVRWVGYQSDSDEWLTEEALKNAPEVLQQYK